MLSLKPLLPNQHRRFFAVIFLLPALLLAASACDNGTVPCVCCVNGMADGITPCECGCGAGAGGAPLNLGYEMARIPAGTFTMGSPVGEPGRQQYSTDETQHQVTLTQFYMGTHELTQAQYERVMGEDSNYSYYSTAEGYPYKSGETEGSRPVECINWYEVIVFCNTLSMREGLTPVYSIDGKTDPAAWGRLPRRSDAKWDAVVWNKDANGYRLPSEAEWEYACRAGTNTRFWSGAADTTLQGKANIADNTLNIEDPGITKIIGGFVNITDNYGNITAPVKRYAPNPYGLYDMHGNVEEWCWDWYGRYPRGDQTDPSGPATGTLRSVRGGHFYSLAVSFRSAVRTGRSSPTMASTAVGFRLARNAD